MPFGREDRRRAKEAFGFRCAVCNKMHKPKNGVSPTLDVHSNSGQHLKGVPSDALPLCTSAKNGSCHQRVTRLIDQLGYEGAKGVVSEAVALAEMQLTEELLGRGYGEGRIRRILKARSPYRSF